MIIFKKWGLSLYTFTSFLSFFPLVMYFYCILQKHQFRSDGKSKQKFCSQKYVPGPTAAVSPRKLREVKFLVPTAHLLH